MLNATTSSIERFDAWHDLRKGAVDPGALDARPVVPDGAIRLRGPWDVLGLLLPVLGRVRVLQGNADWADARLVRFANDAPAAVAAARTIATLDARVLMREWHHGFAVVEETCGLTFCSLQFFDADGAAAHRIYLVDEDNMLAWTKLVACFSDPIQPRAAMGR